ncbi:MAG TPA: ABC transporter permease [Candidatus Acidoferrum sp.]|nr:ABC transporter permease [Candidatus Acidoferrum sp.]
MLETIWGSIFNATFAASILRISTPILLAALGAMISDRAGCANIGLEGTMLISALAGVAFSSFGNEATGPWLGLMAAIVIGAIVGAVMAYLILGLRTNGVLAGVAVNSIGSAGTIFVLFLLTGQKGISSTLRSYNLPKVNIPILKDIPVLGDIVSGQNLLTYVAFIAVGIMAYLLYKTPLGLRIRAVGENPGAAASVGINVTKMKCIALVLSGIMAGLGGAHMSMGYVSWFARDMTAGRGFIALAAEAMGRGTPVGTMASSVFFGVAMAVANALQTLNIAYELVAGIPYFATILGLAAYAWREKKRSKDML